MRVLKWFRSPLLVAIVGCAADDTGAPCSGIGPCSDSEDVRSPTSADADSSLGMSVDSGALDSGRACAMSGNFFSTKDFSGPLCCPGVTTLSYNYPTMRGEERECGFGFAGYYACIEGSCGDGRCEPAEAAPCACPADCPSAVWESTQGSDASTADDAGALVLRDL